MRILIILTLILGINSCTAQSESEKKLIGKWILFAETDSFDNDIEPLTENDSESESDTKTELETTLTFNLDKSIFINQKGNEYNSTYKLTDSILTIGNRNYILIEINKEKLIYKDKDGLFDKHYEYKKAESVKDSNSDPFGIKALNKAVESGEAEKEYNEFIKRRELKIKFDQKEWLKHNDDDNHKNPRWNMLSDLRENYLSSELNISQVINLLGKPFELEKRTVESTNETLNLMLYPVGAYSGFGIDFDFLVISLDENDKKIKVWVEQH